jgi:hypothetical protein
MQINPIGTGSSTSSTAIAQQVQTLRITSGDVSQIQSSVVVSASVLRANEREAVLDISGRTLTITGPVSLSAGDVLSVRLNGGPRPTLDLFGPQARLPVRITPPTPTPVALSLQASVVDVLSEEADGTYRVRIDGEPAQVSSEVRLAVGGRTIALVERNLNGVTLKPLPETEHLPSYIATALLRGTAVTQLGDSIRPLIHELETAIGTPETMADPAKMAMNRLTARAAATDIKATLDTFIPPEGEPPNEQTIRAIIADGGLQYEAKFLRGAEKAELMEPQKDLKSGLLNLLKAVSDFAAEFPAAGVVLSNIERQQAANILALQDGGPFVVQLPFFDGNMFQTISLGLEPDRSGSADECGRPTTFRVMMHVPLDRLGETWIDAGADGSRLRATLFLADASTRDQLRPELAELRRELQLAGFSDVQLDVRTASELTDQQRRRGNSIRSVAPESGGLLDVRA